MNNDTTQKLSGVIELLLESSNRINEAKPQPYWYPLSMATYGVDEILEAVDSMCSFRTTMWEKTREFEERFATYQGSEHSVMVNSGSSADLVLAFSLIDPARGRLTSGDEILIPAVTWPTQIWSAMMAGLRVRLVDVNPHTLSIDLDDLERKITPRTRALFVVHLMGNPCPMDYILALAHKHKLIILEDCCEALGAEWNGIKVGNFGIGGSFSFFFSHHMTTMEGGMVVCQDPDLAAQLKVLRAHGWLRNVEDSRCEVAAGAVDPRYAFVNWGFNLRPTEVQAGFGLRQLDKLPTFNRQRQALAARFFDFIDTTPYLAYPHVAPQARPSWFALPLLVHEEAPFTRREITAHLEGAGIETRPIVAGNVAKHPVAGLFAALRQEACPGADTVHERGFYIGLSPVQEEGALDRVIECFADFFAEF